MMSFKKAIFLVVSVYLLIGFCIIEALSFRDHMQSGGHCRPDWMHCERYTSLAEDMIEPITSGEAIGFMLIWPIPTVLGVTIFVFSHI